jgi:hypothetical protein
MKGEKYVVIENDVLEDLEKNVSELLDDGYELVGGISVIVWKIGEKGAEKTKRSYSQALVRR